MDELTGEWCTYEQAGERLRLSPAAVRARALRGGWRRMSGNDGKARVLLTQEVVRAAAEQPRKPPIAELVNALRAHVETLKGDVVRLEGELVHARANADRATVELKTNIMRLTSELGAERAARRADQEQLAAARAMADRRRLSLLSLRGGWRRLRRPKLLPKPQKPNPSRRDEAQRGACGDGSYGTEVRTPCYRRR
jgi:hypothetical protein